MNPLATLALAIGGLWLLARRKDAPRRNPARRVRRNLDGYSDEHGFHPLRYSQGYDPGRVGERALSPLQDFDVEGKRIQYAARKDEREAGKQATKQGLAELQKERARLKAALAEVRQARKDASGQKVHRPSWAVGWSDENLAQFAQDEGRGRSIYAQDWEAGLRSRETKEFKDLTKRGSAKQQLDRQASALKAEMQEIDRLIRRVRETAPRKRAA